MLTNQTIPTLTPQTPAEDAFAFGLRAFRFVVAQGTCYGLGLSTDVLEAAHHSSLIAVTAPGLLDGTRETLQERRAELSRLIQSRHVDDAFRAAMADVAARLAAPQDAPKPPKSKDGGSRVRVPQPVQPLPPAGGAALRGF